jgi:hypothetical protein
MAGGGKQQLCCGFVPHQQHHSCIRQHVVDAVYC